MSLSELGAGWGGCVWRRRKKEKGKRKEKDIACLRLLSDIDKVLEWWSTTDSE